MSPCSSDYIFNLGECEHSPGAWRVVSEDPKSFQERLRFLLIACTEQIFTAYVRRTHTSTVGYSGFPAYSQVHLLVLPPKRAEKFYLRTVIVTAAVYRGFGWELHSEELTHFLNLPAPGRRQSLYIHLRVSRDLCF